MTPPPSRGRGGGAAMTPMPHPDEEPAADQRELARHMRGMFVALRREGFTQFEACTLLGAWLGTIGKGNG